MRDGALDARGDADIERPRPHDGAVRPLHRQHARREIVAAGLVHRAVEALELCWPGDDGNARTLQRHLLRPVGEADDDADAAPDLVEQRHHSGPGLDLLRRLGALEPDILRLHVRNDGRRIDDRHVERAGIGHLDAIDRVARRQQPPRARAARIEKVEADARPRPRHAGNGEIAVDPRPAALDRETGVDHLPGVGLVDAHQRLAIARPHDPLIDRERPHRRGEVAAIAGPVGHRLVDGQLHERVVDIRVGPRRRPDDHRLGQRGDAPAHAVELAAVGVRAAEHGEQQLAARLPVRRQVAAMKEHALAGAAAIEPCGDPNLAHSCRAFLLVERTRDHA